mgnify:CR=1 FL=1
MKILIDIVHPADALFFLHPIRLWQRAGHTVWVASRHKDVTLDLLDALAVGHKCISTAGGNLFSLGLELVRRDFALLVMARQFKPDVMCGFGGVAISHVGKLLGIPSVSFYDTERAPLQHKLTLPFISRLYVPDSYDGPIATNRTSRFAGTKDLSFFHPENFMPDLNCALRAGLVQETPNYFIRLVGWQANHDIGLTGWSVETLQRFVEYLAQRGAVHISSELPLPQALEAHRYRGPVNEVHHLLAHCQCYIGESATMAGEAVLLGVPAIYATQDRRSYTDELARQGLLWTLTEVDFDSLRRVLAEVETLDSTELSRRLGSYLQGTVNLAEYVADAVIREAGSQ